MPPQKNATVFLARQRLLLLAAYLAVAATLPAQIITTTFKDSTAPGWVLGGTGFTPTLTSGTSDPAGDGWLRLTDNGFNRATYAYNDTALSSANRTIFASVDYAMYSSAGTGGADGLGFFIFDASVPFSIGASGGSLGYAQKTGINGMAGGYIGVGLDNWGNFSNGTEGRVDGPGFIPNSVAVRGPGSGTSGYNYLGGTSDLSSAPYNLGQMDFPTSTTRPDQTGVDFRHFELLLTPTNELSVSLQFGANGPLTKVLQLDLSGYTRPDQIKFGFFAGTGGATDIHEIRSFTMATLVANLWDNAAGTSTWGTAQNWNPDFTPAVGADILFNNQFVSTAQTIDVGAAENRTVRSITFDAPFNYTLNNGTLTFDNSGLAGNYGIAATQSNGSGTAQTINSAVVLNNDIFVRNNSAATIALNGTVTTNGHALSIEGTGNTAIGGVISGTGSLTKIESGTLSLTGNNTFSGGATLTGGTVSVSNNNALGTGTLTLNGGTLTSSAANTVGNTISLQASSGLSNITTSGTLTQTGGSYTLNLANATVAGNVALSNTNTAQTLTTQVDSGTSTISGAIANGGTGAGNLTKTGAGTLVLSGANTYTGTTTISDGTVQLGASDVLANTSAVSIGASGTLNLNGYSERIGNLTATAGGATLDFGSTPGANTFVFNTYTAPSSGVLVVNNWETGTDTLATFIAGQNVGSIYISGYGVAQEAGSTTGTLYGNAYLLTPVTATEKEWDGSSSTQWSTSNNWTSSGAPSSSQIALFDDLGLGRLNANLTSNTTIAGIEFGVNATSSYTISGSGSTSRTLTLTGTVPYIQQKSAVTQNITVQRLQLNANTVVDVIGAGDLAISSSLRGTDFNLIKDGTGTGKVILSGNNSSFGSGGTGAVFVNTGTLQAAHTSALGANAATVSNGATLELSGSISPTNALNLSGSGVGGNGALRSVSGANTASGNITLGADTTLAADTGASLTASGNITGAGKNLTVAGAGNTTLAGAITTGTGTFTTNSTGTVTLSGGSANTFTGDTTVNSGTLVLNKTAGVNALAGNVTIGDGSGTDTLRLGANNQIADTANVTLNAGGVFDVNAKTETIGNLVSTSNTAAVTLGGGNLTVTVTNANNDNYAGTISGSGTLNKAGTGTLTLTSASAGYSGTTNVNAGSISMQNNQALGTGTINVASGGKLSVQNNLTVANNFTINGPGTGANDGAIENTSGTNTLSGTITLGGASRIQSTSGTLNLNGTVSGTNQNLTLGGNGDIHVNNAINLGTGSLTKTDAGIAVLNNATNFTGGVGITGGTLQLGASNVLNSANSVAVSAGATFLVGGNTQTLTGLTGAGAMTFTSGGAVTLTGTSAFDGSIAGAGTLTLNAGSALTLNTSISNSSLDVVLAGGTLNLSDPSFSFGKLTVTANSVIDFGNAQNVSLNLANLQLGAGVTLTVTNWQDSLDYFYAQGWVGGVLDSRGNSPSNQIVFTGFTGSDTVWQGYDHQVTPVPEPSTYGALLLAATGGFVAWRRRRLARR
ncbi:MAG: autotransporter-associated beta strand repeat-containing protein [Opitutae bacterium]|nr:autotransporter-associated beta strand repeat-containing protein [Opitutae bacterium]